MDIRKNLDDLKIRIREAAEDAGRDPSSLTLVAVSKTKPAELIREALNAGQTLFGENRVQEAVEKFTTLKDRCDVHLIGHLQSNKAKLTVGFFSLIHSVDSVKLINILDRLNGEAGLVQDILLQVNTSGEETKSGFEDRLSLTNAVKELRDRENLRLRGLMTIGPFTDDEQAVMNSFRLCRDYFDEIRGMGGSDDIDILSMGMTHDFPAAVRAGATHLRIGSAVFGERIYQ
jgi:pyridoxal phosphate enzyme (YggS family)